MELEYERELQFLCDVFGKCHLPVKSMSVTDPLDETTFGDADFLFRNADGGDKTFRRCFGDVAPCTLYKFCDGLNRCYQYLLLPDGKDSTVLFVGPYFGAEMTAAQRLELGEKLGISPKVQRYFNEYCSSIPVLPDGSSLFIFLDTFCERIWKRTSFAIVDVNREHQIPVSPITETARSDDFDGIMVSMKAMEMRYQFENELMQAVSHGQLHKENQLLSLFSDYSLERRTPDLLRNAKNYCIIMNTLLRKAAEQGGVHPVYLNSVSSEFAFKIEQLSSLTENAFLMREMFRSYCRLVRKHSLRSFSLLVQKTVLLIDSDLSANLTLHTLAEQQNVTSGYLATVFKRETGKTVSEYIREKRVKQASYLLSTTHLQVQTIALHCGIVDVQYFTKIFKKETGKTPKEYRESMRR